MDELFDLVDKLIPGVKRMQDNLIKIWRKFGPVVRTFPKSLKKIVPILKDIMRVQIPGNIPTDENHLSWGKSMYIAGGQGQLLVNLTNAAKDSPCNETYHAYLKLDLRKKAGKFFTGKMVKFVDTILDLLDGFLEQLMELYDEVVKIAEEV